MNEKQRKSRFSQKLQHFLLIQQKEKKALDEISMHPKSNDAMSLKSIIPVFNPIPTQIHAYPMPSYVLDDLDCINASLNKSTIK